MTRTEILKLNPREFNAYVDLHGKINGNDTNSKATTKKAKKIHYIDETGLF